MERRTALKIAAGTIIGGGAGIFTLTNAFRPERMPADEPKKFEHGNSDTPWVYHPLDPALTAGLAYKHYDSGSCMYAAFKSIVSQLAEKHGEPYSSFPVHMMKYGHGGVGGFGTLCGALNASGAIIGLFVSDKAAQDHLISELFRWHETTPLPVFIPDNPVKDARLPAVISNSTLCHASNTNWIRESGYKINSDERKERCRRLTSDVVYHLTGLLNAYFSNSYTTAAATESVRECMSCHGDKGKIKNTSAKMTCSSCHTESVPHKLFADVHYKMMD